MFYDIFAGIREVLDKKSSLSSPNILTVNPSSQLCYHEGKQLGACVRQVWFDKTEAPKTNPISLKARMAGFAGNWWEDWFVDQIKHLGIFEGSQIIATDVSKVVKGFIDVSIINPTTGNIELIEVKTYDGSNYYGAKGVLGTKAEAPTPKMNHLLQAFRYLLIYKDEVDAINLCYIDRACGDWYKYKQFRVTLIEDDSGDLYPKIETLWNNGYHMYTLPKVTASGIELAENKLLNHLMDNTVPDRDFIEVYSSEVVNSKFLDGNVPKYLYDKWQKNPEDNPIGDFQCKYCPYFNGTCKEYD